jgi:hypothetical protein
MTWARAREVALLAAGIALLVLGLQGGSGAGYVWAIGAGLVVGSVLRLAGHHYEFDPSKSSIQQWRERRRS